MLSKTLILTGMLCLAAAPALARSFEDVKGNPLSVKIGMSAPSLGMNLRERDNEDFETLAYNPHARSFTFLSVAYDWWGFTLSGVNPTADEDDRLKGKTSAQDWQFRFNFAKTSYEVFYQTYQGYYLEDHPAAYPRAPSDPHLQFPELRTEHFGGNFLYNWNPDDFSIQAAMDQTERQTKSSWAWLLGTSIHGMRFTTPSSIVPPAVAADFGEFNSVRSARLYSWLAGGGLGGTWVPADRYFLSMLVLAYYGIEMQRVETVNGEYEYAGASTKTHMKLAMGYNGDQWVTGLTANGDMAKYNIRNAELEFSNMAIQMFVGRRF